DEHGWLPSMRPGDTDDAVLMRALAELYRAGAAISWPAVHQGRPGRRIDLPTDAFERRRHWLPAGHRRRGGGGPVTRHPLLGLETTTPDQAESGVRQFNATIDVDSPAYLRDHVVMGQVVFPGAGYVELLLALQDELYGETGRPLFDVEIHEPL